MAVDGVKLDKVDTHSTEPKKHVTDYDLGGVQRNACQPLFATKRNVDLVHSCCWRWHDSMDSGCITQNIKPNKSHGKQKPGMTSLHTCRSPVSAAWNREQRCTLQDCNFFFFYRSVFICHQLQWCFHQILWPSTCPHPSVKLVDLVIYSKLVKKAAKELIFQPISIGTELLGVTFEPISIADHLIRQARFCSLNFVFQHAVDRWKYVCISRTHICASKLKSVCNNNRPEVVRYQEHWGQLSPLYSRPHTCYQSSAYTYYSNTNQIKNTTPHSCFHSMGRTLTGTGWWNVCFCTDNLLLSYYSHHTTPICTHLSLSVSELTLVSK